MSGISTRWHWFFGIAIGGAYALGANYANAQIIPDATLPNNSIVTPDGSTLNITGGTQAGSNLFHSFREFSVLTGGTAFFNNAADIQNIISRVTGGSVSNINGIIRASGTANLFLINPNGIIFGRNASLNIGGSFVATTANAISFGNQGFFSASTPNNPELLTVNPSAFFFNQIAAARIQNNSVSPAGLRVPDGRSLLLLGGNVSLDGGRISAYGGRVELSGLASSGTVGIEVNGNNLSLGFPDNVTQADVSLTNGASVDVVAAGGGSIAVNARNLDILRGSFLGAGIEPGLGSVGAVAGDITLDATESIKVVDSYIFNDVLPQAVGNGGNITISSGSLSLTDSAQLVTSTFGQGNAGRVNVRAINSISLADAIIFSTVESGGVGNGGDINIKAASLSLTDGAQLLTLTRRASATQPAGRGDAGNVNVNATGAVSLAGEKNGFRSGISSSVQTGTVGNGGNITIDSGSFSLRDGASLTASTSGQGDAGNVTITARDTVFFNGVASNGEFSSGAFSTVESTAVGNGGDISITTRSLALTDGAQLIASSIGNGNAGNVNIFTSNTISLDGVDKSGSPSVVSSTLGARSASRGISVILNDQGRAIVIFEPLPERTVFADAIGNSGNINITTNSLSVTNGARLNTSTLGKGNAGSININTFNALFSGTGNSGSPSGAFSTVQNGAEGNSGDINIATDKLTVEKGAQLVASTSGRGSAGVVDIQAKDSVVLSGGSSNGSPSGVFSAVDFLGEGRGGTIKVITNSLSVTDGGKLSANTRGQGDAGSIRITASDTVSLDGVGRNGFPSGASSAVEPEGVGNGGSLTVVARRLNIFNGAEGTVSNLGTGDAGNLEVTADSINLDNSGKLTAESVTGRGGNIQLLTENLLLLRRNSLISAISGTAGSNGLDGNINIDTKFLVAVTKENSDIVATGFGRSPGSNIQVNAKGIFGTQFREQLTNESDIVATGQVTLNTPEIDPNSGLINLPTVPVDTKLAEGCYSPNYAQSSFVITGRGGLPPNPKEVLFPDAVQVDWVTLNPEFEKSSSTNISTIPNSTTPAPIVEATGWVYGPKGEVIFTNDARTAQHHNSWQTATKCHEN